MQVGLLARADMIAKCSVLSEFVDEFKHMRNEIDTKLKQLQTLLAERPPLDQPARNERPN